jgi:hypothetical protein
VPAVESVSVNEVVVLLIEVTPLAKVLEELLSHLTTEPMFPDKVSSVEPPVQIELLEETILPAVVVSTPIFVDEVAKPVHEDAFTIAL